MGLRSFWGNFHKHSAMSNRCVKGYGGILFPLLKDGALFTGTASDPPEKLYDPIVGAFDNAITDIAAV